LYLQHMKLDVISIQLFRFGLDFQFELFNPGYFSKTNP